MATAPAPPPTAASADPSPAAPSRAARPPITSRRGAAADGRERVLLEAQRQFVERGFADVSMQQIADAAGLTKAALYYHFRDKEDLFVHVLEREIDRLRTGLAAGVTGADSTRERLTIAARFFLDHVRGDFGRLMGDMKQHLSPDRCAAARGGSQPFDAIGEIFAEAAANGELRPGLDPAALTPCFVGMIFAQSHRDEFASGSTAPAPSNAEMAALIAGVMLDGVGR